MQSCGDCHICCKFNGKWCVHLDPTKSDGCTIYKTRPEECRKYVCMWLQMDQVSEKIRPDNSYMMFDKISEDIVCGTQDPEHAISDVALAQIKSFIDQGFSVGIITGDKKEIALTKGHTLEYVSSTIEQFVRKLLGEQSGNT